MSRLDAAQASAVAQPVFGSYWLGWLDFATEPVRANSWGRDVTISAYPDDPEVIGTYVGVSADLVSVSSVKIGEGGTDTVTVALSGIPGLDNDMLAEISDPTNYRGRVARLWRVIVDQNSNQVGGIQSYYTGYMMSAVVNGSPETSTITISIESYLASLTQASNRSYLDSEYFDPGDLSGRASPGIANGTPIQGINPGPGVPNYGGGLGGSLIREATRNV